MEQRVRFCTTTDGVRIAYATVGEGPPLMVVSGWVVSNLEFGWAQPDVRAFHERLAAGRTLIRYDKRGTGLSDRDIKSFSLESLLLDLEAVVDTLALDRFPLVGWFEGGLLAILFASHHPDKATRLALYGSFARWQGSTEAADQILDLIRRQWGMGSAALADAMGGDPSQVASMTEAQRVSASAENAAAILEIITGMNVTSLLEAVRIPTLVAHRRDDPIVPFEAARELVSRMPQARLHPLEGDVYPPWWGDTQSVVEAIDGFLRESTPEAGEGLRPSGLVTILFTDMESSTSLARLFGDKRAQEVRRAHNDIVRSALKGTGGNEIKHTGDGIMASFPTASSALNCAIAIQQGVASHKEEHPDSHLGVYIGLNAGEPIAEDDDLFGTSVDLAARLVDHAQPGQIIAADVVRQLAAGKDFLFSDLGETELRGFEDPVKLWELRWEPS